MADLRPERIAAFIEPFRVEPGRKVRLPRDYDPAGTRKVSVREAKQILVEGVELLAEYQMRLAAQDTYGVVMVLQAMDSAGKDGSIRHVMSGVNPQGVDVTSFKRPTSTEQAASTGPSPKESRRCGARWDLDPSRDDADGTRARDRYISSSNSAFLAS
ncbi:MAG: hypothetical protein A2Z32_01720 [Chloroflexi bacterium RBG_16_69_14]|nr:MAG: hypothetical protein A2Z32_01720 [Chloroflexi bacterium RBG_16_69_14]